MKRYTYIYPNLSTSIEVSFFETEGGVTEIHGCIHVTNSLLPYVEQLKSIQSSIDTILQHESFDGVAITFKRYFISDAANQSSAIKELEFGKDYAVSIIQQPPLDGSKVSVWIYLHKGSTNPVYTHLWHTNLALEEGSSEEQMVKLFYLYENYLNQQSLTVSNNCIRTWIYVQNVDVNYGGVVIGRNKCFDEWNMTSDTHYIASTGIEGRAASYKSLVSLDAYAVKGLDGNQITYLHALENLSPTHIYGVAFERATSVEYGDRKHVFVSGTASIDNKGDVVHVGDVVKQTIRMLDNIEALLEEGGVSVKDVAQGIVYLRDASDIDLIKSLVAERMIEVPIQYTHAAVCRPTWLIEMECIAIAKNENISIPIY